MAELRTRVYNVRMTRAIRFGIIAGLILVLLTGGAAALAFNGEGPNAERVVELLDDQEITPTQLDELANVYGLGGAVRILAFADAAGVAPFEIAEMRDDGMGWGEIAREFDLKPGIGWIMGGHGQGQGHGQEQGQGQGQGQEKEKVHGHGGGDTGD